MKKVLVSGCFDLLHAGHVEFLSKAAEYGELYVSVGSDKTIMELKNIKPTYNQKERLFLIENLKCVKGAFIAEGSGKLDFEKHLDEIKPDMFIVNEDGHSEEKLKLCVEKKIAYLVLNRTPHQNLPGRSSTDLRIERSKIPYRIDLAGGWLDQPAVSKHFPGPVLTISIEPNYQFNLRSGFATSTRNKAIRLWGENLPEGHPEELAKILFSYDNPPGAKEVAGSQDSIGIVIPGLNRCYYDDEYWPKEIININDEKILIWLEEKIKVIPLKPRIGDYDVYKNSCINHENAKKLSDASEKCYNAILKRDIKKFAEAFTESFDAQVSLFPASLPEWIKTIIEEYKLKGALGWKLSGAGGGGYLILVSDKEIEGAIKIKIRRK